MKHERAFVELVFGVRIRPRCSSVDSNSSDFAFSSRRIVFSRQARSNLFTVGDVSEKMNTEMESGRVLPQLCLVYLRE